MDGNDWMTWQSDPWRWRRGKERLKGEWMRTRGLPAKRRVVAAVISVGLSNMLWDFGVQGGRSSH